MAARLAAAASLHVVAETTLLRRLGVYAYPRAGMPCAQPLSAVAAACSSLDAAVVQLTARRAIGDWHVPINPLAVAMSTRGFHGQRCAEPTETCAENPNRQGCESAPGLLLL